MKVVKPIQASQDFIHANRHNPHYEILTESDNPELFATMIEYYGECRVMELPDGTPCFFSEVLHVS